MLSLLNCCNTLLNSARNIGSVSSNLQLQMNLFEDGNPKIDVNDHPNMPDLSMIGKAMLGQNNKKSKLVIGNVSFVSESKADKPKTFREELEELRKDISGN